MHRVQGSAPAATGGSGFVQVRSVVVRSGVRPPQSSSRRTCACAALAVASLWLAATGSGAASVVSAVPPAVVTRRVLVTAVDTPEPSAALPALVEQAAAETAEPEASPQPTEPPTVPARPEVDTSGLQEVCWHTPQFIWPRRALGRLTSYRVVVRSLAADPSVAPVWDSGRVFVEDSEYNRSGVLHGCMWRNTGSCSPTGTREPQFDRDCLSKVPSGASGYCQCSGPRRVNFGCQRRPERSCSAICDAPPSPPLKQVPRAAPLLHQCGPIRVSVGSVVRRSDAWSRGDADHGSVGSLASVGRTQLGGLELHIRWQATGALRRYECPGVGAELTAVSPPFQCLGKPVGVGTKVRRNEADWQFGMQDGGPEHVGTVQGWEPSKHGGYWFKVRWDTGAANSYHCGAGAGVKNHLQVVRPTPQPHSQANQEPRVWWLTAVRNWGELGGWAGFLRQKTARAFAASKSGAWGAAWGADHRSAARSAAMDACRSVCEPPGCAPCSLVWLEDRVKGTGDDVQLQTLSGGGAESASASSRRLLQTNTTATPELWVTYMGPPLQPGAAYEATAVEYEHREGATRSGVEVYQHEVRRFRMCGSLQRAEEEALAVLRSAKHQSIFDKTVESLRGRVRSDGYTPTSVASVESSYPGMFTRDTCALAVALLALGSDEDSSRSRQIVSFLLKTFAKYKLKQVPRLVQDQGKGNFKVQGHTAGNPITVDQPDSAFHLVVVWARLVNKTRDTELGVEGWRILRPLVDVYLPGRGPHFSTEFRLILNANLEHSRLPTFLTVYDLLTNSWAVAAIQSFVQVAELIRDQIDDADSTIDMYRNALAEVQSGIDSSLAGGYDGEVVYGELRYKTDAANLVSGMSFVNLSPVSALGTAAVDVSRMDATVRAYGRRGSFLWDYARGPPAEGGDERPVVGAGGGQRGELVPESFADGDLAGGGSHVVLTKGLAWDLAYSAHRGWWTRVVALLRWLTFVTYTDTIGEMYFYEDYVRGKKWEHDPGNAEQSAWYVWAVLQVRDAAVRSASSSV